MDPTQSQKKDDSKLTFDDLRPTTLTRSLHSSSYHGLSTDETPVYRSVTSHASPTSHDSDLSVPVYKSSSSTSSHKISSYPDPKKSGLEIATAAYVPKESHVEPPTVPVYLEPSYHFVCRAKPSFLLETLVTFAKLNGVEFRVLPEKYKMKCVSYPLGESRVPFVASIFLMDPDKQGKRYAVEFQRRSGDIIHFSGLWATCKRVFADKGVIEQEKEKEKLEHPKLDDVTVTDKQIKDTLQCLLQMASSSCYDVKCQAVAALSKMSKEENIQKLMIEESCVDTFLSAACSKMEDIHRCAVFALANLTQSASCCQLIVEKGGISTLGTLSRSSISQVVRDCSRALNSIASRLGSGVVNDEFREALLRSSSDTSTKDTSTKDTSTKQTTSQLEALQLF